jgi:hypothetical protein
MPIPTRYLVRGGGSDYVLNVLTNDHRLSRTLNRTYSILSIGTGPNAPDHGGSVSIVGDSLVYTPAVRLLRGRELHLPHVGLRGHRCRAGDGLGAARRPARQRRPCTRSTTPSPPAPTYRRQLQPARAAERPHPAAARPGPGPLGAGRRDQRPRTRVGSLQIAPDLQSLVYRPVLATTTGYVEQFTYEYHRRRRSPGFRRWCGCTCRTAPATWWPSPRPTPSPWRAAAPIICCRCWLNDFVLPGSASQLERHRGVALPVWRRRIHQQRRRAVHPGPRLCRRRTRSPTASPMDSVGPAAPPSSVRVGSLPVRCPILFSVLSGTTGK